MKTVMTKAMVLLSVLSLTSSGAVVYAETQTGESKGQNPNQHQDQNREQRFQKWEGKFFKDLGLTAEQKEKLKAQRESQKGNRRAAREQMQTKMKALHEALGKPGVDKAQLQGLISEINALKAAEFSQHIDGILAMKSVLTPEQFAKMQARFSEHRAKRGWRGKGQCDWSKGQQSGAQAQDGKDAEMGPPPGEPPMGMEPPPGEPPMGMEPPPGEPPQGMEPPPETPDSKE